MDQWTSDCDAFFLLPAAFGEDQDRNHLTAFSYGHEIEYPEPEGPLEGLGDEGRGIVAIGPALPAQPITQRGRTQLTRHQRNCLECRFTKKKCETHSTYVNSAVSAEQLREYDMEFLELESVMVNFGALYNHVGVLATSTEALLRFDATAIQLHVGCDERDFLFRAGFHEEQTAVLNTREMIHVLRRPPNRLAIDPLAFDKVIAEKLWHKHREQDSRLTKNQGIVLNTARMFCGYMNLLCNLGSIKICSEYPEAAIPKLIAVELVYLFTCRIMQLYRDLGRELQALIDPTESNHYVAGCALELIYKCLCACNPIAWSLKHKSILAPLNHIGQILDQRIPYILKQVSSIERKFVVPYRGDNRLRRHPTMKLVSKFELPKKLRIYTLKRRDRGMKMNSILELLSREECYGFSPLSGQFTRDLQESMQPLQTAATTQQPTVVDATIASMLTSGSYTWNTAWEQRSWQSERWP